MSIFDDALFKNGKIYKSENEEKFIKEVNAKTGLDIVKCKPQVFYLKKRNEFCMQLRLIIMDNDISLKYEKCSDRPMEYAFPKEKITQIIWDIFIDILLEENLKKSDVEYFINTPKHTELYFFYLRKEFINLRIIDSVHEINDHIWNTFKHPVRMYIYWYWTGNSEIFTHLFLYKDKKELKDDLENGFPEKMRKEAFTILKKRDYYNFFNYDEYHPMVLLKKDIPRKELINIIMQNKEPMI